MKSPDLEFLTSALGARVLAELADADLSASAILPLLTKLRKTLSPEQAGAAVEQAELRRKASDKFGSAASQMLFTRDGLEQASDPHIRRYRAQMAQAFGTVIDACCGIGADTLAFAEAGVGVLGLDLDPLRIEIARQNAAALGLSNARFAVFDVTQPLPEQADLIFFDPARRDYAGRRLHHVEQYLPPLSTLQDWHAPHVWAKLSPAVGLDEIAEYNAVIEFHSANGDLKEALLRVSSEQLSGYRTAAVRHGRDGSEMWRWQETPPDIEAVEPRGWLLEPDPALLRAGFVQHLAAQIEAAQIDATIAYLTTDIAPKTPWARAWRILDWMPFNLKRLKAYLREQNIGRVTVKKRGHAMTPEQLQAALKLNGKGEERIVVLTRVKGQPAVIICEPAVFNDRSSFHTE